MSIVLLAGTGSLMGNSVVGEMEGHVFFKNARKADSFSACDQGDIFCSVVWRNLLLSSEPTLSELPLIGHVVVRNTRTHARLLKVVLLYSTIAMKSLYALTVNPVKCEHKQVKGIQASSRREANCHKFNEVTPSVTKLLPAAERQCHPTS